jgi:hypothetical protein
MDENARSPRDSTELTLDGVKGPPGTQKSFLLAEWYIWILVAQMETKG